MDEKTNEPQDVEKLLELAEAAAEEGNSDATREYLRRAVKADPESVQAWDALSYFTMTRDEEIQALEKVLELQPDNKSAEKRLQIVVNSPD